MVDINVEAQLAPRRSLPAHWALPLELVVPTIAPPVAEQAEGEVRLKIEGAHVPAVHRANGAG